MTNRPPKDIEDEVTGQLVHNHDYDVWMEAVREERERIAEIYSRYHEVISPKDIKKLILEGAEPLGWQALSEPEGVKE